MTNPKTTIAGYIIIVASILGLVGNFLNSGTVSVQDLQNVIVTVTGLGLISARDGKH